MDESLLVQVVDARADLNEEVECRVLRQALLLPDKVEEVALAGVLERQVDGVLVVEGGVEPTHVLVVQLLLGLYLSDQRLLDLAALDRTLLDLLNGYLDPRRLVPGQLHFSVRTLPQGRLLRLQELQVFLLDVRQQLLQPLLLRGQAAVVVRLFDKGGRSLDALHVAQQHGVPGLRHLARALELVDLEPVLLEAPLVAVLDGLPLALGAGVESDELLVEFFVGAAARVELLVLPYVLKGALVISALAKVDLFVGGGVGNCLRPIEAGVHDHGGVVEAALGEEADSHVAVDPAHCSSSVQLLGL